MTLREKQSEFLKAWAELVLYAFSLGYEPTPGDLFRDPRCPYGSKSSKHRRRLAGDLNLFIGGAYKTDAESHRPLGEWWEARGGIWGGRFGDDPATPKIEGNDANHYEWAD
jgi:hypothetical protein